MGLPKVGYGWHKQDRTYGSISRARNVARNLLGTFHVAIVPYKPNRGFGTRYEVWYSEIKSSETARGCRFIDPTRKRK